MSTLTLETAAARLSEHITEGRLVQGQWHGRDDDGRELACLLGSFDPSISDASDCPAHLMPQWMAELTVRLFDGVSAKDAPTLATRYAASLRGWGALDAPAWERVRLGFLKTCITQALEAAERVQPTPRPSYWDQVQDACGLVLRALDGDGDLKAAAAWAARAAAEAAEAAEAAAWAAAWAAAYLTLSDKLFALIDAEVQKASPQ